MENEQNIEKIYDLIEKFNFDELSGKEKIFVLKYISLEEYNNMRSTITDTKDFFLNYPVKPTKEKASKFKKLVTYPMELYKIAAIVLLLISIGIAFLKVRTSHQQKLLAIVDTVFIEKTDTIEIIKRRIVHKDSQVSQTPKSFIYPIPEAVNFDRDCLKEICPDDMGRFVEIKANGNISNDTALRNFIVSLN